MIASNPTTDGNGVTSWDVSSDFVAGTPVLRTLAPTAPASGMPHRYIYVLPVKPGLNVDFGDGLEEMRTLGVHNAYNATLIAPSFPLEPWMADHPSTATIRYESFCTLDLRPWVIQNLEVSGAEEHWIVTFSKGAWSGLGLIFRNPTLYNRIAAWDLPADLTSTGSEWTDPTWQLDDVYGTTANFDDNYKLTQGFIDAKNAPFIGQRLIWLNTDDSAFEAQVANLITRFNNAGVLFSQGGSAIRAHSWTSGWLPDAVAALQTQYAAANLIYQWQDDSSGVFADIVGATNADFSVPTTTYAMRFRRYRCKVTDANGTTISDPAVLIVNWDPADGYLRAVPSDANPNDGRLFDPTAFDAAAGSALAEILSAVDSIAASLVAVGSLVETGAAADVQAAVLSASVAVSEAISAIDSWGGSAAYPVSASEAGTAADAINATLTTTQALAEVAAALDTLSTALVATKALSEAGAAVDSLSASLQTTQALIESGASADAISVSLSAVAALAESLAGVDSFSALVTALVALFETVSASESIDGSVSSAGVASLVDTLAASDVMAAVLSANVAINEAAAAVDSVAGARSFIAQAQEAASVIEAIAASLSGSAQMQEAAAAADALIATLLTNASILEQALAADAVSVVTGEVFGAPLSRTRFGARRTREIVGVKVRTLFGSRRTKEGGG